MVRILAGVLLLLAGSLAVPAAEPVARTRGGVPVRRMWHCPTPQPDREGAGFPALRNVRAAIVFEGTREGGAYNHHPKLAWHGGRFHLIWSNHPFGEDSPGQRILYATSEDADTWSDPIEVFPPPGPVLGYGQPGLALQAFTHLALDGRLYTVAGCIYRGRGGRASLAREVRPEGGFGPVFALWDNLPEKLAFKVLPASDRSLSGVAARLKRLYESPAGLPACDFERRLGFPRSVEGHLLSEVTVYRAGDGRHVMLLRDNRCSHRLYASISPDGGRTWPPAEPTDIPDTPSLTTSVVLADGSVLLIGNQTAPAFDNGDEVQHYPRKTLTVAVSPDGYRFERVFALRSGAPRYRVDRMRGRVPGMQYPSAVVREGALYVAHSVGKEDIAVCRVPLASLQDQGPGTRDQGP